MINDLVGVIMKSRESRGVDEVIERRSLFFGI
jgi:hypothetical protein